MRLPVLVWLALSAIWGSTWLFIKIGLEDLSPVTFAGLRFVIAAIPLALFAWIDRRPLPKGLGDWGVMAGTGLLTFTVNYGLVFWGENHISSGLTAILYTTLPLFGLVIAHLRLPEERMTVRKVTGVLLGIAGVALIFSRQVELADPLAPLGSAAVVLASLGTAFSGVIIKERGQSYDPFVLTTVQMSLGLVPLLLLGLFTEGNPLLFRWTPTAWASLFYLALVGSSTTFVLLYWLIKRMEVTKTQLIPLMSTLMAVALGRLVLGEELGWRTAAGGAAVLGGLAVATLQRRRARGTTPVRGER